MVWDVNGKEYLDFNSGQMCSALGHNHPTVVAAIKRACDTMLHAHSSHYNVKEIELAARLGEIVPRAAAEEPVRRVGRATPTRWR